MNIFLTGSNGSVGKRLQECIRNKYSMVYCPSKHDVDLSNFFEVKAYFNKHPDIDLIIHCATGNPHYWEDSPAWSQRMNDDIAMISNLLYFERQMIVLTSGSTGRTEIGWPKLVQSILCKSLGDVIELRPFGIYGPGEDPQRFPSYCFSQILKNEPIIINNNRSMSYVYVDDLCEIIEYCINIHSPYTTYEIANPEPITMKQIAVECLRISNVTVPIEIRDYGKPYEADVSAWLELFPDWTPTPWAEGLSALYEEVKNDKNEM
jgi:UDP-glucose 4-epimerase